MVYTELVLRRQQFHVAPAMQEPKECYQYTTSVDNNRCYKRMQSLIQNHMRHVLSESAQDQWIALYKSYE